MKDRVEAALARVRPLAVQLAIEQAESMLQIVIDINGRLNADGQHLITPDEIKRRAAAGITSRPTDERDLLAHGRVMIKSARDAREREDFALAWAEARRACRPLRTLMYGHWVKALWRAHHGGDQVLSRRPPRARQPIPLLMKPVCCPPAIGFNTLPELYFWIDWISGKTGYRVRRQPPAQRQLRRSPGPWPRRAGSTSITRWMESRPRWPRCHGKRASRIA